MTTQQTVNHVMQIWREFVALHGGHDKLHANIMWQWPTYLRTRIKA